MVKISVKQLSEGLAYSKRKVELFLKNCGFLLILLLGMLLLLKIETHMVSGESMSPTLKNKDRLFIVKKAEPKRYSVITFQPRSKKNESYIKRVIGLPGDRVWLDQNTVYLNFQMAKKNPTPPNDEKLSGIDLPDGTLKIRVSWEVAAQLEGLSTIPKNNFFVLGDNRRHSTDSRELGLIDKNKIEGVAILRYYPLDRLGLIE